MKSKNWLVTGLLIALVGISSCGEVEDPDAIKGTVTYLFPRVDPITTDEGQIYFTDYFDVKITYKDAKGKTVTLTNPDYPWKVSCDVKVPFQASLEVSCSLKEGKPLPKTLCTPCWHCANFAEIQIDTKNRAGNPTWYYGWGAREISNGTGWDSAEINSWIIQYGRFTYLLDFTEAEVDRHGI